MSNLRQDKLQSLLHNELLLKIVKEVFDETIEKHKPIIGEDNDNAILGEKFRAYIMAKELIERSFIELLSYKVEPKKKESFNKSV